MTKWAQDFFASLPRPAWERNGNAKVFTPVPLGVCEHLGIPAPPPDGKPSTRHWHRCGNPALPLGPVVCACQGCGPACPGYRNSGVSFVRPLSAAVGTGYHRSGWPFAVRHLAAALADLDAEVLVDDFVEQSFAYGESPKPVYDRPWAGIFHHPPQMPPWANDNERPEVFTTLPQFRKSLPNLRVAIALSRQLGEWLECNLCVPVVVVPHPGERVQPEHCWHPDAFHSASASSGKTLLQIGWYLRNTRLVHETAAPGWNRVRLLVDKPWVKDWDCRCRARNGPEFPGVREVGYVDPVAFDRLLSSSVVIQELYAASANNGVVDCIARRVPLVVNYNRSAAEYLGEGYPLFWRSREEIPQLIERHQEGYDYLASLDLSFLSGERFGRSVREAIGAHA